MNRIIWGVAIAAIVVWALLTWGSYVLVTQGSEWLAGAGAIFALPPEWQFGLEWSLRLVEQFGVVLLWILWGIVVVTIVVGTWIATRLLGASRRLGLAGGSGTSGSLETRRQDPLSMRNDDRSGKR